jgi:hypothetical protein
VNRELRSQSPNTSANFHAVTIAWDKGPLWVHEIKHDGLRVVASLARRANGCDSTAGLAMTSLRILHPRNAESADQAAEDDCPVAERVAETP